MEDLCIELHFTQKLRLDRNKFLDELYTYILKNKRIYTIALKYYESDFMDRDKEMLDGIFLSYTLEKSSVKLEGLGDDTSELTVEVPEKFHNNEIFVKGIIEPPYSTLELIQNLNFNQLLIYKDCALDSSIVIGSYDYQNYVVISNIDNVDSIQIKRFLINNFGADKLNSITHAYN